MAHIGMTLLPHISFTYLANAKAVSLSPKKSKLTQKRQKIPPPKFGMLVLCHNLTKLYMRLSMTERRASYGLSKRAIHFPAV